MGKYIGIDLGTTFSAAAYIDEDGNPQIIHNFDGENITPSTVLFDDGDIIVGKEAKRECVRCAEHYIAFAKRNMGSRTKQYKIDNEKYTPEEVSAIILKNIKKYAESSLGETVDAAVITVPAYFNDAQRKATTDAAKMAEINVLSIINEPTAAALSYGIGRNGKDKAEMKTLIYDLGGGTFDVSIVQFIDNKIEILSSVGNPELGGYDFDEKIVNKFANVARKNGVDIENDIEAKQRLMLHAEEIKCSLSYRSKATLSEIFQGKSISVEITREEFENMIEPYLTQTISLMNSAIEEAKLEYEDIDKILLVGGSTRIPLVGKLIQEETGIKPSQDIHPDEAVAIGAAYCAMVSTNLQPSSQELNRTDDVSEIDALTENEGIAKKHSETVQNYTFIDRTAHGVGVVTWDEEANEEKNSIVLEKNTVIPAESMQDYETLADYQEEILLKITQGESEEMKYSTVIGETHLHLKPRPKGAPVRVRIVCDSNELIHVYVIDLTDNENLGEMRINRVANMSDDELKNAQNRIGKLNIGEE